jgi:tetratricopeptide (TPR) repeat protein
MSEWLFVDLPSNTIAGLPEPQFPYPIRREKMTAYEVQKQEGLPLQLIADELDAYFEERPDRIDRYRREAAHIFLCAGVGAVIDTLVEPSLHYFKLAIWLDPNHLAARMNYAMSLHQLGRLEEAVAEYREVMQRGSVWEWWQAWMLCAQDLIALGRPAEAIPLLREAEETVPDSYQFWAVLADCQERLTPTCPHCGIALHDKARFCGNCGGKLS